MHCAHLLDANDVARISYRKTELGSLLDFGIPITHRQYIEKKWIIRFNKPSSDSSRFGHQLNMSAIHCIKSFCVHRFRIPQIDIVSVLTPSLHKFVVSIKGAMVRFPSQRSLELAGFGFRLFNVGRVPEQIGENAERKWS
jgi:hypothetical protein